LLSSLKDLVELSVANNHVSSKGLNNFNPVNLKKLSISQNGIGAESVQQLLSRVKLSTLNIEATLVQLPELLETTCKLEIKENCLKLSNFYSGIFKQKKSSQLLPEKLPSDIVFLIVTFSLKTTYAIETKKLNDLIKSTYDDDTQNNTHLIFSVLAYLYQKTTNLVHNSEEVMSSWKVPCNIL
jgi:hypothetical protein